MPKTPEQIKEQCRLYRETHKEQTKQRHRLWYIAHREQKKQDSRLRRKTHPPSKLKARERHRRWRQRHPEKIAEKVRYQNFKKEFFLGERISSRLSGRIRSALRLKKGFKSARTFELVGCDLDWLKAWLEIHFQPGMGWHNYGQGWHLDHIRPCNSFDLTDPKQQKLCFHWTNLQPLWATDNIRKSDIWLGTES